MIRLQNKNNKPDESPADLNHLSYVLSGASAADPASLWCRNIFLLNILRNRKLD
jgi:hypothetical protein